MAPLLFPVNADIGARGGCGECRDCEEDPAADADQLRAALEAQLGVAGAKHAHHAAGAGPSSCTRGSTEVDREHQLSVFSFDGQVLLREFAEAKLARLGLPPRPDRDRAVVWNYRTLAFSNTVGTADFMQANGWEQAGKVAADGRGQRIAVRVPMTTVDAFMASHSIEALDILKVDTEGHDLHVIAGAAHALASTVKVLVFETGHEPAGDSAIPALTLRSTVTLLGDLGFACFGATMDAAAPLELTRCMASNPAVVRAAPALTNVYCPHRVRGAAFYEAMAFLAGRAGRA